MRFLPLLVLLVGTHALDNGLARTPPLGWSTWQTCGDTACGHDVCNEAEVKSAAIALNSSGMQALGYNYVNLDDCWVGPRDNSTNLLTWDTSRFPSGIPALTAWLHARGLKFGLYTSAGNTTCANKVGSRGHYKEDAQSFADWGVDYVKFDWCGDIKKQLWLGAAAHKNFSAAMNATGRPMVLDVVAGFLFLREDISVYANTWRFCTDHHDNWKSTSTQILCRYDQFSSKVTGAPGGWASMDFLMTGGAGCKTAPHCPGQTAEEYKTEFAVWSLTQSPLLVDTDIRTMTSLMQKVLLNKELISLHQSTLTPPGRHLGHWLACDEALACNLYGREASADGAVWVVALVNMGKAHHKMTLDFSKLSWGRATKALVYDVFDAKPLGEATGGFEANVASHASAVVRLTRAS